MEKYYIWLLQLFRPSNPVIHKVLEHYGDPETAFSEINNGDTVLLDDNQRKRLGYITLEKAESVLDFCEKSETDLITIQDSEYPKLLKEIFNPPSVLFVKGSLKCLNNSLAITAVGAREITPYIEKISSRICTDLAKRGIVLVSGLARGVDSIVHKACIKEGTPTIGVMACGINVNYPAETRELREQMAINGGAYLTELLPGTPVSQDSFLPRNRILAGLSKGTAVFQADVKSGSLITANYAVEENRDVFCVPPPDIFDPSYAGVVKFLRDGAVPIFNHDDIINAYPEYFANEI